MYYGKRVFFMHKYRKRRKNKPLVAAVAVLSAAVVLAVSVYSYFSVRRTVLGAARNNAAVAAFNIANRVIGEQMDEGLVTYNEIVKLTKNDEQNITALEIDIVKINRLKSIISSEIAAAVTAAPEQTVSIPVGTLFGNEYTLGFGPTIKFKMQIAANVVTDFESNFYSAGINQVLHQIVIRVKINGNFVLPWNHSGFSTETTVIAAQTVLVGLTPDAYTSVIENYGTDADESRTVDDIFDYAAQVQ